MTGNSVTRSGKFRTVLLFLLPLTAWIVTIVHRLEIDKKIGCYTDEKQKNKSECKAFVLPLTSTLHGVLSRRIPNEYIFTDSKDASSRKRYKTLDVIKMEVEELNKHDFELWTKSIAVNPWISSKGGNNTSVAHFNTRCNAETNAQFPNAMAEDVTCLKEKRESYAAYALDCYKHNTMEIDYSVSPACQCLHGHMLEISGRGNLGVYNGKNTWITGDVDEKILMVQSVKYCSARSEKSYTVEYAGTMSIHKLAVSGMFFLVWGLFSIVTRWSTQMHEADSKPSKTMKFLGSPDYYWSIFSFFSQLVIAVTMFASAGAYSGTTESQDLHGIMRERDKNVFTKDSNTKYLNVASDNNSTQSILQFVLMSGIVLQTLIVMSWLYCYVKQHSASETDKRKWRTYIPVLARIATDLPFIAGFSLMGVSVILQNGSTNYTFLQYNVFVIVAICLLQHVSNVTKLFYDAVCRKTYTQVFYGLQTKNQPVQKSNYGGNRDLIPPNEEEENIKRKKITTVLQFFGWIRVWIFLLVTFFCLLLLTGTNELAKSLTIGNFTQSQLLVFVLVLYLSNVTYDIVRELLPVQFEKHDADSARLWIITAYIVYYFINQTLFIDKMNK